MKRTLFTIVLFIAGIVITIAGQYEDAMKTNITKMYQAKSLEELNSAVNMFSRIAQKETDKWLPNYYAAYSYISMCYIEQDADKIDEYLDNAQPFIDAAMNIKDDESELYVLQSLLYSMRITNLDRGMKYSGLARGELEKAKKLNPENPRIYNCLANNIFHTPAMFDGGKEKALPLYEKALKLFESWEAPNEIWPSWGLEHTMQMKDRCID